MPPVHMLVGQTASSLSRSSAAERRFGPRHLGLTPPISEEEAHEQHKNGCQSAVFLALLIFATAKT